MFGIFILFLSAVSAFGEPLSVKDGNIYLTSQDGTIIRLTNSGLDSDPCLSLDQRMVVFVRRKLTFKITTGAGVTDKNELWITGTSGKEVPHRVLLGHSGGFNIDDKLVLAGFSKPQFSPDGKRVYFEAETWGSDNSARVLDLATGKVHFLYAGNDLQVVQVGRYAGYVIALKDIPRTSPARVGRYWLLDGDGNEAGEIGDQESDVRAFLDGQRF